MQKWVNAIFNNVFYKPSKVETFFRMSLTASVQSEITVYEIF